jgi:two-component system, OmpR family, sensor histidine kinase YxdK
MKARQLLFDFIADNLGFTAAYFINTSLLLIFFDLFYKKIEIIYPVGLTLFIFFISMVLKWFKFRAFNKDIHLVTSNALYKLKCFSTEQKRVGSAIEKIHFDYMKKISLMELADKEKRRLISQFIHSLKTPITVIDIAASSLMEEMNEEVQAIIDIQSEKEKILINLNNILNILRLEEFASDYSPGVVDLDASLKNIINSLKRNFVYGHVVPRIEVKCVSPLVYTDEKWNAIMLEQFISNGIKYSLADEDLKPLFFTIAKKDDEIILSIKDKGIGIPDYDISRISEPFFTGENGRKVRNSSGVGLYIAYKIANHLNHKIEIISKPGQGTQINISYLTKM